MLRPVGKGGNAAPEDPAMLMTGYIGGGAVEAVGDVGAGPFVLLRKPVAPDRFADRIMALLDAATPALR
jgi:hypothetical protein